MPTLWSDSRILSPILFRILILIILVKNYPFSFNNFNDSFTYHHYLWFFFYFTKSIIPNLIIQPHKGVSKENKVYRVTLIFTKYFITINVAKLWMVDDKVISTIDPYNNQQKLVNLTYCKNSKLFLKKILIVKIVVFIALLKKR